MNHPKNEWMFDEAWGVDVAVSTPRMLSALVEEAVSVGDLVRLFTFRQGNANLVELTLPPSATVVGTRVVEVQFPVDTALVAIIRDTRVIAPSPDDSLEAGDELLFVCQLRAGAGARGPARGLALCPPEPRVILVLCWVGRGDLHTSKITRCRARSGSGLPCGPW